MLARKVPAAGTKALPRHPKLVYRIGHDGVLRVQDGVDLLSDTARSVGRFAAKPRRQRSLSKFPARQPRARMGGRRPVGAGGRGRRRLSCWRNSPADGKKALPRHPNLLYKIGYDDVLCVQDGLNLLSHCPFGWRFAANAAGCYRRSSGRRKHQDQPRQVTLLFQNVRNADEGDDRPVAIAGPR